MRMIDGIGIASDGSRLMPAAVVAMEKQDTHGKESHVVVVVVVDEVVGTKRWMQRTVGQSLEC